MMKIWNGVLALGLAVAIGMGIWNYVSRSEIAYVTTGTLINEYLGMQEANEIYQQQRSEWQSNLDSLKRGVNTAIKNYKMDSVNLTESEKIERKSNLLRMQQGFYTYSNTMAEKVAQAEEKMTMGVLNQINSYISEYGKAHGYTIILGTSSSGNILYGDEAIDITEEILEGLNKTYKGDE